jgi:hypothetical protein
MPRKVPRATDWQPPNALDIRTAQKRLDVDRLPFVIQEYLPTLAKENQMEVLHIVKEHLLYFLVKFENSANRPKVKTLYDNIDALESALREVRTAMDSLDAASRYRLVAASVGPAADRGANRKSSLNFADLDEVTLQALEWTKGASKGLPRQGNRSSPPGLDVLVEGLARLFKEYDSRGLRSTNRGNLGDLISSLIGCLNGVKPLTRDQIDYSLRKLERRKSALVLGKLPPD